MKYIFFFLLLISGTAYSQSTYYIRADSTRLQKVGGNNELIIENSTRTLTGAYLKNNINGRTTFDYAVDSGSISGSNLTLWRGNGTQNIVLALPGGGGGSGTVTSFSAGTLSPLFTTSVATATTTPALTFTLSNAASGTVFGNRTASSAAPTFTASPVLGITGTTGGMISFAGATSGLVLVQPGAVAGTYNFNLPNSAGSAGQVLTSQGGGGTLMTWTTPATGTGTVTSVSVVTNQGVSGSVATATTTPAITLSLGALTGVTSINGLVITANTGVVTTGTWNATAIGAIYGGTGQTTVTTGDILYGSASNVWSKLGIGTNGQALTVSAGGIPTWTTLGGGSGTVTSVSFTGGLISVANPTTTPAFTVAGTSGGIPYFSSTTTWASSALLAANAIMIGGGTGTAPATTTTASGILTWIGTPSSANLRGALTDENGTGAALFNAATTPDFTTGFTISTAAASRKMIVGNGTSFVPSTETWAVPGTTGNVLTSDGTNWTSAAPATSGTVTSVSVVTANGLAGTVATATTTPAITLSTTITGMLRGNGTAISAGTDGTHYLSPATGWTLITNIGLTDNVNNFFGTASNVPIRLRVAAQPYGGLYPSGIVNIGLNSAGGTSVGSNAGANDVSASQENAFFGLNSGRYNMLANKTAIFGLYGQSVNGNEVTLIGVHAGESGWDGVTNSFGGYSSGRWNRDGSNNNGWGGLSLYLNTTVVESVTITNGGTGYGGTPPTVTFTTPPTSVIPGVPHVTATGTAIVDGGGVVTGVTMILNGSGYGWGNEYGLSLATVTFSGGSGSGATGTIVLASGDGNTAMGGSALAFSEWGDNNTAVGRLSGYGAGSNEASYFDDNSTFIGAYASRHSSIARTTKLTNATVIGYDGKISVSNALVLGGLGASQPFVGIGLHNPSASLDIVTPATSGIGLRVTANSLTTGQAAWISSTTVTNGNLLYLGAASTAVPGNTATSAAMYFDITGANASSNVGRYGQYVGVTATGTTSTNVGSYYNVGNATNNYAILVQNGTIGVGVLTPTANLHLKAGAAAAGSAPLKLNTGTAMTTPEDGAFEYHTSHLYFTIGSTRYQLDQQGAAANLTVGTSTITGGADTRILYDNAGNLGEYTITGTGTVVAMQTSPSITTSLVTGSTTFALLNTTATTINAFGAATTVNTGASATQIWNFGGSTTASEFRFLEPSGSGTNYSAFKAVAQGASITYSLPPTVGAAGTVLTDAAGNGVLTWAAGGGGGATVALDNLSAVAINAALVLGTSDAFALGSTTKQWSDLFLAEGGVINWDNGDATLTQAGDVVTLAGADLKVTTPGNAATSVLTTDGTQTQTNKRITLRVGSTTSSATPTINTDNLDFYHLTAQTADITSFTTNLTGTPTTDQRLHIAVTGTAARAITWGATFEASSIPLPTTTISTNRLDVHFIWNAVTSKWRMTGAY